jgi:hypothetical protein
MKNLESLKELLDRDVFGDPDERLNPEVSCTGMCYRHAEENEDVVASVEFFLKDHCDGGNTCDKCDVFDALNAWVSNVVVVGSSKNGFNIMNLNEGQIAVMVDALRDYTEAHWSALKSGTLEEEEAVCVQGDARTADVLHRKLNRIFE